MNYMFKSMDEYKAITGININKSFEDGWRMARLPMPNKSKVNESDHIPKTMLEELLRHREEKEQWIETIQKKTGCFSEYDVQYSACRVCEFKTLCIKEQQWQIEQLKEKR